MSKEDISEFIAAAHNSRPEVFTPVEEEKEAPSPEPQSKAARRLLEKEAKLREERQGLEEQLAQIKAFNSTKDSVRTDPNAHLSSLGLTREEKLDFVSIILAEENPDLVTEETLAKVEGIKSKYRETKLEERLARLENPEKPKEDPELNELGIPKVAEPYYNSLAEAVIDPEKFPYTANYASISELDKNEVTMTMFRIAVEYAEEQKGQGAALTPEQCMQKLEAFLEKQAAKFSLNKPEQQTPEAPTENNSYASLNSQGAIPAPPTQPNYSISEKGRRDRINAALKKLNLT